MKSLQLTLTALALLTANTVHAGPLVISENQISANQFTYTKVNSGATFTNPLEDALISASQQNVDFFNEGGGSNYTSYERAFGGVTSAQFILGYDFSTSNYQPTAVTVLDKFLIFENDNPNVSVTLTSDWSVDGVTWINIKTLSTTGIGGQVFDYSSNNVSLPGDVASFFYRYTATATEGSFLTNALQWGRTELGQTMFAADFTVVAVPEPSTIFMALCGIASIALLRRGSARS